jgi:hypothetical protein
MTHRTGAGAVERWGANRTHDLKLHGHKLEVEDLDSWPHFVVCDERGGELCLHLIHTLLCAARTNPRVHWSSPALSQLQSAYTSTHRHADSQSGKRISGAPDAEALVHGQRETRQLAFNDRKAEESEGSDCGRKEDLVHCHLYEWHKIRARMQARKQKIIAGGFQGLRTLATPRIAMGFCLHFREHIRMEAKRNRRNMRMTFWEFDFPLACKLSLISGTFSLKFLLATDRDGCFDNVVPVVCNGREAKATPRRKDEETLDIELGELD